MNTLRLRIVSLLIAGGISSDGCLAQGLPEDLPQLPFSISGSNSNAVVAGAAIASLVVYIIEKHQASERQKQIAEERARRAYANMSTKRKAALKSKKVRYIAVDTEKDSKTSPEAKKSVMVWDTESQKVAGGNVYDVKSAPKVGSTAKFENYSAEYVGSGT